MNGFFTLMRQDIKKTISVYTVVVFAWLALCASIVWLFGIANQMKVNLVSLCYVVLFAAHPFLLARLFSRETLVRSDQQWFSLPLRRSTVVLSQVSVMMIFLLISAVLAFLWSIVMVPVEIHVMEDVVLMTGSRDFDHLIPFRHDVWGHLFNMSMQYFQTLFFSLCAFVLLGAVVFVYSIRYSIRWFNTFLQYSTVLAIFILFCMFGLRDTEFHKTHLAVSSLKHGIITGVALIWAGLVIFDKTAEL